MCLIFVDNSNELFEIIKASKQRDKMKEASSEIADDLTESIFTEFDDLELQTNWNGLVEKDKKAWVDRMYKFSKLRHFMDKHKPE